MNVDIALFASLSEFQPDGEAGRHARTFDLPEGTTIADMIAEFGLPDQPRIIFVNGRHAPEPALLHDGDRLAIFPPVAGG
ncbi:MAG: MoaD/ThiS family protein [Coriobacteriia bacterium]|nr:MoaD/ThiS family protein [Coriobacteriia bacterium]